MNFLTKTKDEEIAFTSHMESISKKLLDQASTKKLSLEVQQAINDFQNQTLKLYSFLLELQNNYPDMTVKIDYPWHNIH